MYLISSLRGAPRARKFHWRPIKKSKEGEQTVQEEARSEGNPRLKTRLAPQRPNKQLRAVAEGGGRKGGREGGREVDCHLLLLLLRLRRRGLSDQSD